MSKKDATLDYRKIGIGQARLAMFEQTVETGARRRNLVEENGQAVDGARVAEVTTHPLRWRNGSNRYADTRSRGLGLQLIREAVQVAALLIMEKAPDRGKESESRTAFPLKRAGQKSF